MFKYKGFIGKVAIDEDEKLLIGHVINLAKDGIDFAGKTVGEAEEDFHGAVDDYLSWAEEEGFEPEKPYQGNFLVRATAELHREAATASTHLGISLNNFVIDSIWEKLHRLVSAEQIPDEFVSVKVESSPRELTFAHPPEVGTRYFLPGYLPWDTIRIQPEEIDRGSAVAGMLVAYSAELPLSSTVFESTVTIPRHETIEEASEPKKIIPFLKEAT